MPEPLVPARLAFAEDGTPWSPDYGDVYHSADGGPGQARHVFLAGNVLPERWRARERFVILETGFGTGLNFLTTWAAWREDPRACRQLHYLAVEAHPFSAADLAILHARWPEFTTLSARLRTAWPVLTPGTHRLHLEGGRVVLTLLFGEVQRVLPRLSARVDAFYLDGFAPQKNPEMWSPGLFRRLARLATGEATLATWSVAAGVREGLEAAGFRCEKRPGFGRKRQMLSGRAPADTRPAGPPPAGRHALVIGAGLAGAAVCERLAARDWRLTLIERHAAPAREASGNLAGIVRPLLSLDDNIASRFTRAAYLHTLRHWREMDPPPRWSPCGVLHIARDAAHEAHQRQVVQTHAYPEDYVRFLDRETAVAVVGWPLERGGWLFPTGGWAHPPAVCAANLARCGEHLRTVYGRTVARLERQEGQWRALDAEGRTIASAPVAVLAGGAGGLLPQEALRLPLRQVRGQVTHIPAERLPPLRLALCREGYLTPPVDGLVCVGASYDFDAEAALRVEENAGNLTRLGHILPGAAAGLDPARLSGRVGFRSVAPDRLPLGGPLPARPVEDLDREARLSDLPRLEGCYGLLGLASRGLVWAQLAAELLASRLEGEPLPVETDLAEALDPARFLLRRLRRGGGLPP